MPNNVSRVVKKDVFHVCLSFRHLVGSVGARGVLHCQHGQWGLEALIPWWFRAGTCVTSNPEALLKSPSVGMGDGPELW